MPPYLGEDPTVDKNLEFASFERCETFAPVLEYGVARNGSRVNAEFPEMSSQVVHMRDVDAEDER